MNASEVIAERYRLERPLGTGGMAEVWLAEDLRLGRWVALKVLRSTDDGDDFVSALEREARVVARLSHPGIVSVYDAGRVEGRPYVVMEYVHGLSVRELMEERGRMPEAEALRYGQQIASALRYAHEKGVIHCDIKPENILVTEQGAAKAVDFGIAETMTRTLSTSEARSILGTIAYLAPEVIQGRPPDARSDVYALAMTIYEMVAGRLPFAGVSAAAAAGQRLASAAPLLRTFAGNASPELERVLARGLAPVPEERYPTAGEFANALRRVAAAPRPGTDMAAPVIGAASGALPRAATAGPALPPRRHPTSRLTAPPPRRGRNTGALWGLAIVLALLVGGGVAAAAILVSNSGGGDPGPTPTVVPTPATVAPTATRTPTPQPSATPTASPSPSPTATATATATLSPTPTRTPTPGPPTATPTRTPTPTATVPPTATPTPTPPP